MGVFHHAYVVSCVYPVEVLSAAFSMTCSLLMLVEDTRGDHIMEEAYSRACLITILYIALSVSCSPYPVEVSTFIICRSVCACTNLISGLSVSNRVVIISRIVQIS